jgi:hypothetical protein
MTRILKTLAPVTLILTLAGCPAPRAPDAGSEQKKTSWQEIQAKQAAEDAERKAAEQHVNLASVFMSLNDVVGLSRSAKKPACLYVAVNNTPVYVDISTKTLLEKVDGGMYPKLDGSKDGYVRSVSEEVGEDVDPDRQYRVVYIPENLLVADFRDTDLFKADVKAGLLSLDQWVSSAARLCTVPEEAIKAALAKPSDKPSPPVAGKGTRVVQKEDKKK